MVANLSPRSNFKIPPVLASLQWLRCQSLVHIQAIAYHPKNVIKEDKNRDFENIILTLVYSSSTSSYRNFIAHRYAPKNTIQPTRKASPNIYFINLSFYSILHISLIGNKKHILSHSSPIVEMVRNMCPLRIL